MNRDSDNHRELSETLEATSRLDLQSAFMEAVAAFAQYAEGRDDVPAHVIDGFALGFLQTVPLRRLVQTNAAHGIRD